MSKDKSVEEPARKKSISFHILDIRKNHHDRKDLMIIIMRVDCKSYKLKFLMDDYNVLFYPEFRQIDKYGGAGYGGAGGFKNLHQFLQSIHSKVKYYFDVHMNKSEKSDFKTYEKEWWMGKDDEKKSSEIFDEWVKKNSEYLIQYDLSIFDDEMIKEIVDYIEIRERFVQPVFINVSLEDSEKLSLSDKLKEALKLENYEEAVKIREEIKKIQ